MDLPDSAWPEGGERRKRRQRGTDRGGGYVDGVDVVLGLSFCGPMSHARRRPTTRTVLDAAGLVQVPHDEVAVSRARQ